MSHLVRHNLNQLEAHYLIDYLSDICDLETMPVTVKAIIDKLPRERDIISIIDDYIFTSGASTYLRINSKHSDIEHTLDLSFLIGYNKLESILYNHRIMVLCADLAFPGGHPISSDRTIMFYHEHKLYMFYYGEIIFYDLILNGYGKINSNHKDYIYFRIAKFNDIRKRNEYCALTVKYGILVISCGHMYYSLKYGVELKHVKDKYHKMIEKELMVTVKSENVIIYQEIAYISDINFYDCYFNVKGVNFVPNTLFDEYASKYKYPCCVY